ncbi:MAG: OmpH family outer membrane protein [Cellulophaga sp.]|nr:OmpH family outer membrane protein [Cellulophaga sp.]
MKKIIVALAIFTAMACQESKIGFIDNQKIMTDYQEKKDVEAKFQTKVDAFSKKRDSISQSFQMRGRAFEVQAQKMTQSQIEEQSAQFQQEGQFIGQQLQQEQEKLQTQNQTEMDSIISKVKREIQAYGKANGYSFILGGGDGGSVLYGEEAKDVTAPILKILNDNYKK